MLFDSSDKWEVHWSQLKAYKEKFGHSQVPTHFSDNPKLGRWVHTQRHQRRLLLKGKKSCMTPERIALLDQLEFSWEVRPSLERPRATWQQRFEELQAFYEVYQHFCVPAATHPQLQAWCHEQKQRLKVIDKSGKDPSKRMGPDRVKSLSELGFTMDVEIATLEAEDAVKLDEEDVSVEGDVVDEAVEAMDKAVEVTDKAVAAAENAFDEDTKKVTVQV
jgi:hypothetical protein